MDGFRRGARAEKLRRGLRRALPDPAREGGVLQFEISLASCWAGPQLPSGMEGGVQGPSARVYDVRKLEI